MSLSPWVVLISFCGGLKGINLLETDDALADSTHLVKLHNSKCHAAEALI
jgi:hypothetical protein